MTTLRLVADDLTGALDAAAQFTSRLGSIPCFLSPRSPWLSKFSHRDLALNAASRDGSKLRAVGIANDTASMFGGADIAFKKIDSLLRGHWAAELATLIGLRLFRRVVFNPAFPAQRRIMRAGRQWAAHTDGTWIRLAVDPVRELESHGVRIAHVKPHEVQASEDADVLLCDAETQGDLEAIVRAASGLRGPVLWCGAAGLARALSGRQPIAIELTDQPHLAIFGTPHPVSQKQIDHAAALAPHCVVTIGDNPQASASKVANALLEFGRCLARPSRVCNSSPHETAMAIADRLRDTFAQVAAPPCVTVAGGETLLTLCEAVGTEWLAIEGEIMPGLPASRMIGGLWDGTLVFSKSGAFGDKDTLAYLLMLGR